MRRLVSLRVIWLFLAVFFIASCSTNAPPEVITLHTRESQLIQRLSESHLALAKAYHEARVELFDAFFFTDYLPAFFDNWKAKFKEETGTDYDADNSEHSGLWHNDMIAEYHDLAGPLEESGAELQKHLENVYRQTQEMHEQVAAWIRSVKDLNDAQRQATNRFLRAINPALSLDSIDDAWTSVQEGLAKRLSEITGGGNGTEEKQDWQTGK